VRRQFTDEFKAGAVGLVLDEGRMVGQVACELDLTDSALRNWVKHELGERFESCGQAKMELFDYIEVFYNQRRRHSTLGQISPAEFERRRLTPAA